MRLKNELKRLTAFDKLTERHFVTTSIAWDYDAYLVVPIIPSRRGIKEDVEILISELGDKFGVTVVDFMGTRTMLVKRCCPVCGRIDDNHKEDLRHQIAV